MRCVIVVTTRLVGRLELARAAWTDYSAGRDRWLRVSPSPSVLRPTPSIDIREWFGNIDIYLFDQLLKGRLRPDMRVLDAGCGPGRNLTYLLRAGFDVYGVDLSAEAIAETRAVAGRLAPSLSSDHFRVEPVEQMSFPQGYFDFVICSAVLHFARDEAHFEAMVRESWRVLAEGGIFFARLASTIGIESLVELLGDRRYRLPDGTQRFLVDEGLILATSKTLGGGFIEPVKTVNVENQRCMTTWCLRKRVPGEWE